jgi:hypothetical protein
MTRVCRYVSYGLCAFFFFVLLCRRSGAIGFESDDYIVAGFFSGQVGVYDYDFSFKGHIDSDFPMVADVEFDPQGNLVAIGQNSEVRVYSSSGTLIPERSLRTRASVFRLTWKLVLPDFTTSAPIRLAFWKSPPTVKSSVGSARIRFPV